MKGGGIRGIAYGGALQELERQDVLAHITRVGGTSAGAIQAALLAVGYAPEAIIDIINRTPVQRLNDGRYIFIGGGSRLLRQYGWYCGDQLTKYLCELVGRQAQRPNLTLGELHQLALAPYNIRDFSSCIGALYTVALENINPALPSDWPRTISINTMGFSPKVRHISDEQKAQLVASGRAGVQVFFGRAPGLK